MPARPSTSPPSPRGRSTPTPRTACSAASRWCGPARATRAPAAAPPAAAADHPTHRLIGGGPASPARASFAPALPTTPQDDPEMPLTGTYEPTPWGPVADQVADYERTGGLEGSD